MSEPDQDSSPADDESSAQDSRLDHVLAEYLRRVAAGEAIDREQFIAEHSDVADRLRQYFETADIIQQVAGPAARFDEANIDRDAATLPPSSLAAVARPAREATPEIDSGPQLTRMRYFGDYELLEEIARGGMGVVYKARQVSLNRLVAVKMILAGQLAGPDDVRRFRTEAEAAAQLQHPNIVAIHEVGEHDGQHYFSMDYVDGTSLAALVRENPLPAKQAAAIVKTVAEAIHYAHTKGILHRDLKPSNVLMQAESGGQRAESQKADSESGPSEILALSSQRSPLSALRPRLTDFGLAKRIEGGSELTGTGQILGTPSYMPPEQAGAKRGEIGPHSDVYSLGAILYELLTGRPPFRAETPLDTLLQVLEVEPASPRLLNPRVPADLGTICLKCLQKDRQRRYPAADELANDLGRFLAGEPVRARQTPMSERLARWVNRRITLALLVGVLGWLGLSSAFLTIGALIGGTFLGFALGSYVALLVGGGVSGVLGAVGGAAVGSLLSSRTQRMHGAEQGAVFGFCWGVIGGPFVCTIGVCVAVGAVPGDATSQIVEPAVFHAALRLALGAGIIAAILGGVQGAVKVQSFDRYPGATKETSGSKPGTDRYLPVITKLSRALKRPLASLVMLAALCLVGTLTPVKDQVIGVLKGEKFAQGMPTSYWIKTLRKSTEAPNLFDRLFASFGIFARPDIQRCRSALAQIGPDAIPALVALLNDTDNVAHREAALALAAMGPSAEPAIPAMLELLVRETETSFDAACVLGGIGAPAVPHLIALLEGGDIEQQVRWLAISALGEIGPDARAAVPVLLRDLTPSHWSSLSAGALRRIDPEALTQAERERDAERVRRRGGSERR